MSNPGAGPDISRFGFVADRIIRGAENNHDERVTLRITKIDAPSTARGPRRDYTVGMYPLPRKTLDIADLKPGETHRAGLPFDKELTDAFNAVQPERFRGDADSSVESGVTDPDVEDSIGGE